MSNNQNSYFYRDIQYIFTSQISEQFRFFKFLHRVYIFCIQRADYFQIVLILLVNHRIFINRNVFEALIILFYETFISIISTNSEAGYFICPTVVVCLHSENKWIIQKSNNLIDANGKCGISEEQSQH